MGLNKEAIDKKYKGVEEGAWAEMNGDEEVFGLTESVKEEHRMRAYFDRAGRDIWLENKTFNHLPNRERKMAIRIKNRFVETKMQADIYKKRSIECQITDREESRKFLAKFHETASIARHTEEELRSFLSRFEK